MKTIYTILPVLFLSSTVLAEPSTTIEVTTKQADVAINASILQMKLSPQQLIIGDALAEYYKSEKARGAAIDANSVLPTFNKLKHNLELSLASAQTPYSYADHTVHRYVALGKKLTDTIAQSGGVKTKFYAATASAALGIVDAEITFTDHIRGPGMQIVNQWQLYGVSARRDEITEKLAELGASDPNFALAWQVSGLGAETNVNLSASGPHNKRANDALFSDRRIANIHDKLDEAYDEKTKTFKVNENSVKQAMKDQNKVITDYIHSRIEERKNAEKSKIKEINFQAADSSIYLLSKLLSQTDPKGAKVLAATGTAAVQIARAIDVYGDASKLSKVGSAVNLAAGIAGALDLLITTLVGAPDMNKIILDEIASLRADISSLKKEMHERFDRVDDKLLEIYDRLEVCYQALDRKLELAREDINHIKVTLNDVGRQIQFMHRDISLTMREGFRQAIEENITRCLELDTSMISLADFNRCIVDIKTYAIKHASNSVHASKNVDLFTSLRADDLTALYTTAGQQLESSVWSDLNLLSYLSRIRLLNSSAAAKTVSPLPNVDDYSRYSRILIEFMRRSEPLAPLSSAVTLNALPALNAVLEKGEALKLALTNISSSDAAKLTAADHIWLLQNLANAVEAERTSFEKENGYLSVDTDLKTAEEIPMRGRGLQAAAFQEQNSKGLISGDLRELGTFNKLRACPNAEAPDESRFARPEFDFPIGLTEMVPNQYRMAVLRGLGSVYICWDLIEWNNLEANAETGPGVYRDAYAGVIVMDVSAFFRTPKGQDLRISRRQFVAPTANKTVWKRVVYKGIDKGPGVFEKGEYQYVSYPGEPNQLPLFIQEANRLWYNVLAAEKPLTLSTERPHHYDNQEERTKAMGLLEKDTEESILNYKRTFSDKLTAGLVGRAEGPIKQASQAVRGSYSVLRSHVFLSYPESMLMNDELNALFNSDRDTGLTDLFQYALQLTDTVEVKGVLDKIKSEIEKTEQLRNVFATGRYPDGQPLKAGKEMHIGLEHTLTSLKLMKQKIELGTKGRPPIGVALSELRNILAQYGSTSR